MNCGSWASRFPDPLPASRPPFSIFFRSVLNKTSPSGTNSGEGGTNLPHRPPITGRRSTRKGEHTMPDDGERNDGGGTGTGGGGKTGLGPDDSATGGQIEIPISIPFELQIELDPSTGVLRLTYRSDGGGTGTGGGGKVGLGGRSSEGSRSTGSMTGLGPR